MNRLILQSTFSDSTQLRKSGKPNDLPHCWTYTVGKMQLQIRCTYSRASRMFMPSTHQYASVAKGLLLAKHYRATVLHRERLQCLAILQSIRYT